MRTLSQLIVVLLLVGIVPGVFIAPCAMSQPYMSRDSLDERHVELIAIDTHTVSLGVYKKSYVDYLIATGSADTRANRYGHVQYILDAYLLGEQARKTDLGQDSFYLQFKERKRKEALGGRYYEIHLLDKVADLTEAERRKAYAYFNDKVHVRQLYFTTLEQANTAYEQLEQGKDFINLANEVYQTVAFDSTAGDMGIVSYFEIDDALAEAAFALTTQYAYTHPVRSREGYHILRLENRYTNPMITESAYLAHGTGVGEDMQLRKIRLEGDAFVRSFMDDLNYHVNTQAVEVLVNHVKTMTRPEEDQVAPLGSPTEITAEERASVQSVLTPETVLVEYEWEGRPMVFTAGAYFGWLNSLPYKELKRNPAASVGRALRNEVFGMAGERDQLDLDPIVQESIYFETQLYLAREMKARLREDTSLRPSEEMVYQAFERLAEGKKQAVIVDYWFIPCDDLQPAEQLKTQLESNLVDPSQMNGFVRYENKDSASDPEWMSHVRQAPVGRPMVVGLTGGRWFVLNVTRRDERTYQFEDVRASLEAQLAPYAAEYYLLNDLYKSTPHSRRYYVYRAFGQRRHGNALNGTDLILVGHAGHLR